MEEQLSPTPVSGAEEGVEPTAYHSSPQAECTDNSSQQTAYGDTQDNKVSFEQLIEPLSKDRRTLSQLKSQLTMELLWIKQAIASRQEVWGYCIY